jgi:flagellar hook-associated protein 3 FlgL
MDASMSRVSNALLSQLAVRNINNNMQAMLGLQHQLATGLRLYKTSVDPSGAAVAMAFQTALERREQTTTNIDRSSGVLASSDTALADLQTLLNDALDIASTNIGAGSDDTLRQSAATVVSSLISRLAQIGNRQYGGTYLFAGRDNDTAPFDLSSTRARFVGDNGKLYTGLDATSTVQHNLTAEEAFGTLTGRVTSTHDLNPAVTLATRVPHLNAGEGVRLGSILLNDGTTSTTLDLSGCDTVGDIVNAINNNGVVTVTAAINAANNGLVIQAGVGDTISVQDLPGGFVAADLGILQTTPLGAGVDLVGSDLDRILTRTTELAALQGGAGLDQVNGLIVSVGDESVTIDISTAVTMEDLLNDLNYCGLDIQAEIDSTGRRLSISNAVASESMRIGENGGMTARQLGVRSMTSAQLLSDLNDGLGVRTITGKTDLEIVCTTGATFEVDLSSAGTLQDVIIAINVAAGNPGVTASMNPVGNGLRLTDATGGALDFQCRRMNSSYAATDLGIEKLVAAPGTVIVGDDVAPVYEQGVFHYLYVLRDALLANDSAEITRAGDALRGEVDRVASVRGIVGVRLQTLAMSKTQVEDEQLQLKGLLSEVRDLDYAAAATRFSTLETTYQASLQTAASILPLSLLDFLR